MTRSRFALLCLCVGSFVANFSRRYFFSTRHLIYSEPSPTTNIQLLSRNSSLCLADRPRERKGRGVEMVEGRKSGRGGGKGGERAEKEFDRMLANGVFLLM